MSQYMIEPSKEKLMVYNVSFDICAVVMTTLCISVMVLHKDLKRFENKVLFSILLLHFAAAVLDIWSSVANSFTAQYSYAYRDLLNLSFLLTHCMEAALFAWYLMLLFGLDMVRRKTVKAILIIPELAGVVLPLALNNVFRWVFYYDKFGVYSHGPMMYPLYGVSIFYMVLCCFIVLMKRNLLTRRQWRAMIALLLTSLIPILIQMIFIPHQLIEMFFQSVGFYMLMTTVDNFDDLRNPVTKVYNRFAFIKSLSTLMASGTTFRLIVVKLSKSQYFKSEGYENLRINALLHFAADWLDSLDPRINVYDCARGFFVLPVVMGDAMFAADLRSKIAERFKEKWTYSELSLTFAVQLCTITLPQDDLDPEQILEIIDMPFTEKNPVISYTTPTEIRASMAAAPAAVPEAMDIPQELSDTLDAFLAGVMTLTPAEKTVFQCYTRGMTPSQISEEIFISVNTVKKHTKSIYRKLEINSRNELIMYVDLFRRCRRTDDLENI